MKEWLMPLFIEPIDFYSMIKEGMKKVEGRVPDPSKPEKNYSNLEPGDVLVFWGISSENYQPLDGYPEMKIRVSYNHHYESVEEMISGEGLENALPGVGSVEEAVSIYNSFPGYPERIKKYGVHAIGLGEKI